MILVLFFSCKEKSPEGLDTKFIASNYHQGLVKVIRLDEARETKTKGSGYLGRGSGFIVTPDGYVFTNRHVIEFAVKGYVDYDYYEGKVKKPALDVY